jgi:hypothetical protein
MPISAFPYKKSMSPKKMSVTARLNAGLKNKELEGQEVIAMFTVKELKEIAKMYNLRNYSTLKRDDLAYFIMKYWSDDLTDAKDVFYNRKF